MIKTPMRKQAEAEKMRQEIKAFVRPALAVIWSIFTFLAWIMVDCVWAEVPEFFSITAGTCVVWFFSSREKEKADARKGL